MTFISEKHQGARILEEKNTRSHWPKRKRGQLYGSTVKRNTEI